MIMPIFSTSRNKNMQLLIVKPQPAASGRREAGDWIMNIDGDVYTVDRETFARMYRAVGPGTDEKVAPVWAEVAEQPRGHCQSKSA